MDRRLLEAAKSGDAMEMKQLALDDPGVLVGITPQGNTCLHIATIHGHEGFCKDVLELQQSLTLLTAINKDGETPLLTAVTRGRDTLASVLLRYYRDQQLALEQRAVILKQDKRGCNVLHHAIRRGYRTLALELIEEEPALSKAANERDETPMFIAAMRNFEDVLDKLLGIPDSAHSGPFGFNALHAAVRNGNKVIAKRIMETRPWLVSQETENKYTPMHLAAYEDKIDVLTVLLEHDPSLGYLISTAGKPLLCTAASEGHVGVARELLKHCPDAPYCDEMGSTCLHEAVVSGQEEFVEFVLRSQELQHLINLADNNGETALHLAGRNRATNMIDALLLHQDIDITILDNAGNRVMDLTTSVHQDTVADDTTSTSSSEGATTRSSGASAMDRRLLEAATTGDVADDTTSTSSSEGATTRSSGAAAIDRRLLEAATTGDAIAMHNLAFHDPSVLLGSTPQGNNCLHIAAIHGHEEFCSKVLMLNQSLPLLKAINADGETPLLTAVARGRATLASDLLRLCRDQQLSLIILKQDKGGFNALHYAVFRGHRKLALELIEAEPALSKAVNKCYESPMFIAVMRGYGDVLEKLLEIPYSAHGGACGYNALHAAVTSGNAVMAKRVMEARPGLVRQENRDKHTPVHLAAHQNKIDVLRVLLEQDPSLGYSVSTNGAPLLCIAAIRGNVGVARELLRHCLDPPHCDAMGLTCLHIAVSSGQAYFVRFVVTTPQLQHLVNLPDNKGETALNLAHRIMRAGNEQKRETMMRMVDVLQVYLSNASIHAEPFTSVMERLFKAAVTGDARLMKDLTSHDPSMLLATTPQGSTCLHIAAIHGHEVFCKEVQTLNPSLLGAASSDDKTPLLAAVVSGRVSVASVLLRCCRDQQLSEVILKQDKHGCNALHHAIRSGHRDLALELIEAEPALSHAVNQYGESPMFVAVMRNYDEVFDKLLELPDSADGGVYGWNSLHAAVRNGNSAIAKKIMETRPGLARKEARNNNTPTMMAVASGRTDMLSILLEHDRSLGYHVSTTGNPLLTIAARRGHVGVAREILKHCPDAPCYSRSTGSTCLHDAVWHQRLDFVKFVLGSLQLQKLVNKRDSVGNTALHLAVKKCDPNMVTALLLHPDIDVRMLNNFGCPASWLLSTDHAKTLNWNQVSMLIQKADPQDAPAIFNQHKRVKDELTNLSRKDIKSLTQTYTGNTSLVAILIATITFAAAFTLPGGYSTDVGNEGLPIMARKIAFKAFLISDTLAMCSSFAVAFICIVARWEDLEFLLYYRSFTKKLMWFAYMATTTAFATGLYTVLAPRLPWLAAAICVLTSLLPILTKLLGEWPILRLKFRLGRTFKSELLDMV